MNDEQNSAGTKPESPEYEAPAIEEVVTPASIEREAHYAGVIGPSDAPN